jgi:hypothetical protein
LSLQKTSLFNRAGHGDLPSRVRQAAHVSLYSGSPPLPAALVDHRAPRELRHHGASGHALTYIYFEDEAGRRMTMKRLTRDEARQIAVARLPDLLQPPPDSDSE